MYHNCTITIMQLCIFIVATFEHIKLIVFLLFRSFVQPQIINRVYSEWLITIMIIIQPETWCTIIIILSIITIIYI